MLPPTHVCRHERCGLALSAIVAIVPCCGAAPMLDGCERMNARRAVCCAYAVNRITGNPASITPTAPGNTQPGSPITVVAAHAVTTTTALMSAHRPNALRVE